MPVAAEQIATRSYPHGAHNSPWLLTDMGAANKPPVEADWTSPFGGLLRLTACSLATDEDYMLLSSRHASLLRHRLLCVLCFKRA